MSGWKVEYIYDYNMFKTFYKTQKKYFMKATLRWSDFFSSIF